MPGSPSIPDPLDLDQLATVLAHLRRFPREQEAEVLARIGVPPAAFEAASASWTTARDKDPSIARRLGAAFGRALRQMEKDAPTLDTLRPLVSLPAPVPVPATAAWPKESKPKRPVTMAMEAFAPPARLPFVQGQAAPGRAFEAAVAHAQAVQGPAQPAASLGDTIGLSGTPARSPLTSRPPPVFGETVGVAEGAGEAPRVPPGVPDLSVPQYASLRVELQMSPGHEDAVLARYGIRREAREPLDEHWRARFQADPLLRMMFAKAYATYIAWVRDQRGA